MFGSLGPLELLIILLIVIALFGAGRIAGVGRALGTSVREFRKEAGTGKGKSDDEEGSEDAEASEDETSEAVASAESNSNSDEQKAATAKKDADA